MISSVWSALGAVAVPSDATVIVGALGSAAFQALNAACTTDAAPLTTPPDGLRWTVVAPKTLLPDRL